MNVETRLVRLEKQNRWLRASVAVALLAAVVPWMMGSRQEVQESITTKELTIVDAKGLPRGKWYAFNDEQDNFVTLELYGNPSERKREKEVSVILTATPKSSVITAENGGHASSRQGKVIWRSPTE
jgi:hypothetical protein